MFKYASKQKYKTAMLIAVCLLAAFSVAFSKLYPKSVATQASPSLLGATNEQRIAFLKSCGIETEQEPFYVCDIIIPSSFDGIYEKFEDIQNAQGFSLSKYKGKKVRRFSYSVKSPPKGFGKTSAELLVYDGRIVACALCDLTGSGSFAKIIS